MSGSSNKTVDSTLKPLPGGKRIITYSSDRTIKTWNVQDGEQEGTPIEHGGWLHGLAVTRDGKKLLTGGEDRKTKVWDMEMHRPMAEWSGHESVIRCIAMSPDDQLVASCDNHGRIIIREMEDGRIKHRMETGSLVFSVCFSPDGKMLASGHRDFAIRVFDVKSGNLILGPIKGHTQEVISVLWSTDGSRIFSGSWDRTIRYWNSENGVLIGDPCTGHANYINRLALSPDGATLASAASDSTVRFWATGSGDPVTVQLQHELGILQVLAFSPSGEFLACGGKSGKLSIWPVPWWDGSQKKTHKSFLDVR